MRWQLLGERRAISLLMLGFYSSVFFLVALSMGGSWAKCFFALTGVYALGFFAMAAEWFWARWYAMGLGMSGITMAILGIVTTGWNPGLAIWGGMHLLIYAPLLGDSMADLYDNKEAWRQRFGLDEYGVERLKRAVKGAATALPTLVFYTLAPRQDQTAHVALLLLAGLGLFGLIRMRFWGVALLGIATVWTAISAATAFPGQIASFYGTQVGLPGTGLLATFFLALAVSPFVLPAFRMLRKP